MTNEKLEQISAFMQDKAVNVVDDYDNKVYYQPGDIVRIKHPISNRPVMLVKNKAQKIVNGGNSQFIGMRCIWFNAHGGLEEATFNTKDLEMCAGEVKSNS